MLRNMHLYRKMNNNGIIWSQMVHFVTTLLKPLNKKTYLTKVVKEYALMKEMPCRPLNMESFGHKIFIQSKITGACNQKTSLTIVVKEYTLIKIMLCRPLNMESFGHKMFILSQPYLPY